MFRVIFFFIIYFSFQKNHIFFRTVRLAVPQKDLLCARNCRCIKEMWQFKDAQLHAELVADVRWRSRSRHVKRMTIVKPGVGVVRCKCFNPTLLPARAPFWLCARAFLTPASLASLLLSGPILGHSPICAQRHIAQLKSGNKTALQHICYTRAISTGEENRGLAIPRDTRETSG